MKFLQEKFIELKTKFYPWVRRFLNLSLYWKVGFIIGSCFFINFFIALYFYLLFYHVVNLQTKIPYNYELLTSKALTYLEKKKPSSNPYNLKVNLEKILHELEGVKEKYSQITPQVEKIEKIISQTSSYQYNTKTIKLLEKQFLELNKFFSNERNILENKIKKYKEISKYFQIVLILTMLAFLIWGTWSFYYMVKKPLDSIVERLDFLTEEKEEAELKNLETCVFEYSAKDEIGKVINKVNEILTESNAIRLFKRTIENDESVEMVYERLGYYLQHMVGIGSFIIFEVSNSQNTMQAVYVSDPNLDYSSEIILNPDKCRAKRTGQIVTSINIPNICKVFPFKTTKEHYCIPMMYGGKCIGVIGIYLPKEELFNKSEIIKKKLKKAHTFIKETIPVIEAKRYAEALKEQTFRDALTGLYNRYFLEATLDKLVAQILRRESILGVLMCDLDYFKSINDKYGHDAGDVVLKETAKLLVSNVRKSDLVVRFGGEEFLILLVDVKKGESVRVADKLRSIIETHEFKIPQGGVKRTISIGVSEFPIDTGAIWEAIKFADVALYKAKELGRNKVVRFKREFWTEENY